jgi:UDP-2,3-diacylglucosamine pyrophosphatase LpxH
MLVIISDLHLTDGTSGKTIGPHAFRIFRERLGDLAYEASWRSNGKYKPIDELNIVLLGDILDVIRSTKWLEASGNVRPWSNPKSQSFTNMIRAISEAILQTNSDSLSVLNSLSRGNAITLPPADSKGKPAKVGHEPDASGREPVKVNIHYLVGNHDWFYHLPGASYDGIRKSVVKEMGLANLSDAPFPHDSFESDKIQQVYEEHQIFARHGDIFDSFNYEQDRNTSSLGDAIVVELLNRFPDEVENQLGDELPEECTKGLREIDNVRPLLVIPIWIVGLLNRTCPDKSLTKKIKQIWDELADDFLELDFVRKQDSMFNLFDNVDKLEWALKFSRGVSLSNLSRLVSWIRKKAIGSGSSFYANAFRETAFKNRKARFIVFGHTHHHEIVPLDSAFMSSGILNQMYINSGTWRPVHELARLHPDEQEFMGYQVMTFLAFFKGDERGGRPFESWSGALGVKGST